MFSTGSGVGDGLRSTLAAARRVLRVAWFLAFWTRRDLRAAGIVCSRRVLLREGWGG